MAPGNANRESAGDEIGFDFTAGSPTGDIEAGDISYLFYVVTNATNFVPGTIAVIDSSTSNLVGYAPSSVPLPPSVLLLGSGLFGVGLLGRRKIFKG